MTSGRPKKQTIVALLLFAAYVEGQEIKKVDLFKKSVEAAVATLEVYKPWDEPAEVSRVNRIGYEIAQQSGFTEFPFSFYVVDMAIPNAFALPAGHIFITRGMLSLDLTDDMLAGLLGHEIAHVTQEHFLKMQKRATLFHVLSSVLTVGVLIGASQSDSNDGYYDPIYGYRRNDNTGDIVQGIAVGGMVVTELLLRSYSRVSEDEADEEGQRYAAAAGYDPDGTRQLMARMESRLPQDQTFGYWQTHPFFEDRVRAAGARQSLFTIQERSSAEDYRKANQLAILDFIDSGLSEEKILPTLKQTALDAWPSGLRADALRLEKLHLLRDAEADKKPLSRDYGPVLEEYRKHRALVAKLTPDSRFLTQAEREIELVREELDEIYPLAQEVLRGEVHQTPFLATFLSNFPDSEEAPIVALKLGEAYSRLSRETEAVDFFLQAWQSDPSGQAAERARRGLRSLAPYLERLSALQQLVSQEDDESLALLAEGRLRKLVSSYVELENGADYLARFPDSESARLVSERLDQLADELYKEVILYQRMGDSAKAAEGIHQILSWAPVSEAARELSAGTVIGG